MPTCVRRLGGAALLLVLSWIAGAAWADVGQIKVAKGRVIVERKGQELAAQVGMPLETADVVKTGPDGAVGITMRDNSLLSAGPNSIVSLERFEFDATTSEGRL